MELHSCLIHEKMVLYNITFWGFLCEDGSLLYEDGAFLFEYSALLYEDGVFYMMVLFYAKVPF